MASKEQQDLANVVKTLHRKLRKDLKEANGDYAAVWEKHCFDQDALQTYASAMHTLATKQWAKNSPQGRADWCHKVSMEYFRDGGLKSAIDKQNRRISHNMAPVCCCCVTKHAKDGEEQGETLPVGDRKLLLLDVGSCYNPFSCYPEFASIAIDLCPANKLVCQCDFLHLNVTNRPVGEIVESANTEEKPSQKSNTNGCYCDCNCNTNNRNSNFVLQSCHSAKITEGNLSNCIRNSSVLHLPAGAFDVIIFSLLLSYFPSPNQRWDCCVKAHQLLAVNGILIIITPDSSHQNRNAAMMKSWKHAIQSIGFTRWKYVKQTHVHSMVFRKVAPCHKVHMKGYQDAAPDITPDMLYTRQDFGDEDESENDNTLLHDEEQDEKVCDLFEELPLFES